MFDIGDSVRTKTTMFFVEATHPEYGEAIEVRLPKWHRFIVCGVFDDTRMVEIQLPDGYVATLSYDDVEL